MFCRYVSDMSLKELVWWISIYSVRGETGSDRLQLYKTSVWVYILGNIFPCETYSL